MASLIDVSAAISVMGLIDAKARPCAFVGSGF